MPIAPAENVYWSVSDNRLTQWYNVSIMGTCSSGGNYSIILNAEDAYDDATKARAMALLRSTLDDKQIEDLETHSHFYVIGSSGRRYKIGVISIVGNVEEVDDSGVVARYCAHPMNVPIGDAVLAQKLWLEHDEDEFKKAANCHWQRDAVNVYC